MKYLTNYAKQHRSNMDITTEYSIGDRVFFMEANRIESGYINKITVEVTQGDCTPMLTRESVHYGFLGKSGTRTDASMFKTKGDLIAWLITR